MAKKKVPELTFEVIKSFTDPKTSDERIKEILLGNLNEDGHSDNAICLFNHDCIDYSEITNPQELIKVVKIYSDAVERALTVCGDDLLYYFRFFGNDNAYQISTLLTTQRPTDTHILNSVGIGLSVQNDIVCQYVLVNQDKYPHFAAELCKYNNEVINKMNSNWVRLYNQTEDYNEDDIVVFKETYQLEEFPLGNYICDGSPLHFRVWTTNNETDFIGVEVYTAQYAPHHLCSFNSCFYSNIGTDADLSSPEIILDIVANSDEPTEYFPEFVTKAINAILNMIKKNLLFIDRSGYMYYGIDNIDNYDWNDDYCHYTDSGLGGKRVVEILMSDEIPSENYKFFDKAFTNSGFKDSGVTPYIACDEEGEETVYNMHRYYQVVEIKSLFPDDIEEDE